MPQYHPLLSLPLSLVPSGAIAISTLLLFTFPRAVEVSWSVFIFNVQHSLCLNFRQILANFGLLVALLCAQCAQRLFFGSLRPQEIEVCRHIV